MGSPLGISAPPPPNVSAQQGPPPSPLGQLAGVMGQPPAPGTAAVTELQEISKRLTEKVAPLVQQSKPGAMVWFRRAQEAINNLLGEIGAEKSSPAPVLPGPASPLGPGTNSAAFAGGTEVPEAA